MTNHNKLLPRDDDVVATDMLLLPLLLLLITTGLLLFTLSASIGKGAIYLQGVKHL